MFNDESTLVTRLKAGGFGIRGIACLVVISIGFNVLAEFKIESKTESISVRKKQFEFPPFCFYLPQYYHSPSPNHLNRPNLDRNLHLVDCA